MLGNLIFGPWVYGSYGAYIWAFPIQQLIVLAGVRQTWLLILLAVPAAYFVGQLSWWYVELPTQRLRRHLKPAAVPRISHTELMSAKAG